MPAPGEGPTTIPGVAAAALAPAPCCYLCGGGGTLLFPQLRDRLFGAPGEWALRRCSRCGLIWLDPRPGVAALSALHAGYYTHAPDAGAGASRLRVQVRAAVLDRTLGYDLAHAAGAPGRQARLLARLPPIRELVQGEVAYLPAAPGALVLDVGCGDGRFLALMRDLGWRVRGVEPDPAAAVVARSHVGDVVAVASLEDAGLEDVSADAITLNHVVEHLPDPVATLRECRRILRPGGLLVVRTPNARSLGRRWFGEAWLHWDPPRHLFVFTPGTLRECLARAGLAVRTLRTVASGGRWSWAGSRALARGARIPGWTPTPVVQNTPGAIAFTLLEHLLCGVAPLGEELLAIAGRE